MDRVTLMSYVNKQVFFGSHKGEKTLGTLLKVNVSKCVVVQDENRGGHFIGTRWNVPFDMIYVKDASGQPVIPAPAKKPITDFWIMDHQHELNILMEIYGSLSPENLSGDGERPIAQVRYLRAELERKLKACFVLLEREVDESECYTCIQRMNQLIKEGKTSALATLGG